MRNWIRRKLLEARVAWLESQLFDLIARQHAARIERDHAIAELEELKRRTARASARRQINLAIARRRLPATPPARPRLVYPHQDTQ